MKNIGKISEELTYHRCEQIFKLLGKQPWVKKCEAMEGLLKASQTDQSEAKEEPRRDAAINSAAQKVEHYEIASYGTLRTLRAGGCLPFSFSPVTRCATL